MGVRAKEMISRYGYEPSNLYHDEVKKYLLRTKSCSVIVKQQDYTLE